jgi:hypothetical protein
MTNTLENRIAAQKRKIEALDARIGILMSKRADAEDKLASLYDQRK